MKYVEYEKLSKKKKKELDKKQRTMVEFNIGTRVHEDKKRPTRAKRKANYRKENRYV